MDSEIEVKSNNMIKVLKGSVMAVMVTLVLLLIYSCVLTFTEISENTMSACIIIITCISILIGSSISTITIKKNGLLNGGLVGVIYVTCLYIFSSTLQTGFSLTGISIIMMICGIITGMLGGIIGVNLK